MNEPLPPRLYCGDKEELPEGYDGFGSRYVCLKKGYGIALHRNDPKDPRILTNIEIRELATRLNIPIVDGNGNRRTKIQILRAIAQRLRNM